MSASDFQESFYKSLYLVEKVYKWLLLHQEICKFFLSYALSFCKASSSAFDLAMREEVSHPLF
jgi:hypothetical protein